MCYCGPAMHALFNSSTRMADDNDFIKSGTVDVGGLGVGMCTFFCSLSNTICSWISIWYVWQQRWQEPWNEKPISSRQLLTDIATHTYTLWWHLIRIKRWSLLCWKASSGGVEERGEKHLCSGAPTNVYSIENSTGQWALIFIYPALS